MSRLVKNSSKTLGLIPGTSVFVGKKKTDRLRVSILDYNIDMFDEKETKEVEDCFIYKDGSNVTWINVTGLHEIEKINALGKAYKIHPLIIEDILNTTQRPKIEIFDDYIFVTLKMLTFDNKDFKIYPEQISLIMGKNYVISFQEKLGDVFDPLRERIRLSKGRVRKMGSDYLMYSILDILVDYYFVILEKVSEQVEIFEERLLVDSNKDILNDIYTLKKEILFLRKTVWPLREAIHKLEKAESSLINEKTNIYFRDVYDHLIHVIDTTETSRDLLTGMLDLYLSSVSNKMNEIMKVLTIIATIFIPLTFIVGIYGMNFDFMPELSWRWSYFGVMGFMAFIGLSMVFYFRRKKWI